MPDATLKLCECGCGQPAPVAKMTSSRRGHVKGEPVRFVHNHHGRRPLAERFWEKVDRSPGHGPWGDCHIWTGGITGVGYGGIKLDGRMQQAHRVAWFLETGEWPDPCALHHCDNPPCVRFGHLFEGTHDDNMADKIAKGREVRGAQACGAKLTVADVLAIREASLTTARRDLAVRYGVSKGTVGCVVRRETWAHVAEGMVA